MEGQRTHIGTNTRKYKEIQGSIKSSYERHYLHMVQTTNPGSNAYWEKDEEDR